MLRQLLIVGMGSFMGGALRYAVTRLLALSVCASFPMGTLAVNVLGCLVIGFFTALDSVSHLLTPAMRLLLVTGFCGGFTTFSTFVKDTDSLLSAHQFVVAAGYLLCSVLLGFAAFYVGQLLGAYLSR